MLFYRFVAKTPTSNQFASYHEVDNELFMDFYDRKSYSKVFQILIACSVVLCFHTRRRQNHNGKHDSFFQTRFRLVLAPI